MRLGWCASWPEKAIGARETPLAFRCDLLQEPKQEKEGAGGREQSRNEQEPSQHRVVFLELVIE
jgi:hypothetical protein